MRLDEIINTHRQSLNDTDMVIWKYILQHREVARHISITKLHDNTLASLSTVNLYISPAEFQLYDAEDGKHISFKSMMPYFMLIEVWYVK